MTDWDKTDIIHFLSDLYGYTSYLEMCTSLSGGLYHKIERSKLKLCHRLMYRCPDTYDDQMEVNFRSPHFETKDLIETIQALGLRYDIVLVDPFHTYDVSYRDLVDALSIVTDRGAVIVHDCLPPSEDLIARDWTPGAWCGVTFMAYIDFVNAHPGLTYMTVDTDYGCGVIRKGNIGQGPPSELRTHWEAARQDAKGAYRFMAENKTALLNLVSVDEFRERELRRRRSGARQAAAE
jgi:hypothetical protein